ncbi:hypothetical protein HOK51_05305 [Candidatus Woesearchaeota archaeon]|nr:hypothetical protein [Candidatus Woesearchaeota archaeon]
MNYVAAGCWLTAGIFCALSAYSKVEPDWDYIIMGLDGFNAAIQFYIGRNTSKQYKQRQKRDASNNTANADLIGHSPMY